MPRAPRYRQGHRNNLDMTHWQRPCLAPRNLAKKDVAAEPRARGAFRKSFGRLEKKQALVVDA
eukprot:6231181-Pyramimonas_sp.AAC.1